MTLNYSRMIPNPNPKYAPQRKYARTKKGKIAADKARVKRYVKLSDADTVCLCGSTYNTYHRARHCRTKKHERAVRQAELEGLVPVQQRPQAELEGSVPVQQRPQGAG